MGRLFFVPIIHSSADLGSIEGIVEQKGIAMVGEQRWEKHKKTIDGFWKALEEYFDELQLTNTRIYQDGLAANGELGLKIVKEAALKGSKNHQIVLKLINSGGVLQKTEDIELLKQEAKNIKKLVQAKGFFEKVTAYFQFLLNKNRLLKERDDFVAKTINNSLGKNEVGVLFLGAFHNVLPKLDKGILVKEVKEREKVEEYQKIFFLKSKEKKVMGLSDYLTSRISNVGDRQ